MEITVNPPKNRVAAKLWLSSVLLAWLCFASAGVMADSTVNAKLAGFEWRADAHVWLAAEIESLAGMATDGSMALFMRKRALLALGQINSLTAEQQLLAIAQSERGEENPPSLRRRAVDIVCTRIPMSEQPAPILNALVDVTSSDNGHLRHRAALCLKGYEDNSEVFAALEQYLGVASEWERLAFEEATKQ
jgi:signal transduction histidine kinase